MASSKTSRHASILDVAAIRLGRSWDDQLLTLEGGSLNPVAARSDAAVLSPRPADPSFLSTLGVALPAASPPASPGPEPDQPLREASLQASGGGAATKASAPPTPPPQPLPLERGQHPWAAQRVDALIAAGTIEADWLPDIRATALTHLQIQNSQQREMLRFSNAIANTGANNWQVRRGTLLTDPGQMAITSQELLDDDGQIAAVIPDAALSEYHPEHKHFHIGETAEFGVEMFNASTQKWDAVTGLEVVKSTFCLIDVNQIRHVDGDDPDHYEVIKSPANRNVYNDCFADMQGIQAGWIDRYNHSLPGQEVDITDLEPGVYRIVTTVNPSGWFIESDFTNNVGWTAFELSRDSNGNASLRDIPGAFGGIWFDSSSNGMG